MASRFTDGSVERQLSALTDWKAGWPVHRKVATAVLLATAAMLPVALPGFALYQISTAILYAITVLAAGHMLASTGLLSLGHAGFVAIGAYGAAVLLRAGVPFVASLALVVGPSFILGYCAGRILTRLNGAFFGIATFALALSVPRVLKAGPLQPWLGASQGLSVPAVTPLADDRGIYAASVLAFALTATLARLWLAGPIGRGLRATRDDAIAAASLGVDVVHVRSLALAASGAAAALAGALSAVLVRYLAPESFGLGLSISVFVGLLVGRPGSSLGALFGGCFVVFVPNLVDQVSQSLAWAIYGTVLILVIHLAWRRLAPADRAGGIQ